MPRIATPVPRTGVFSDPDFRLPDTRPAVRRPPTDGGYPADGDLQQMSDDGGPVGPDPARWADRVWRDEPDPAAADTFGGG